MKKGILFDLDGTLWDSSKEVAISWTEALKKHSDIKMEITTEMIQGVMGKSMTEIADIFLSLINSKGAESCWKIAVRRKTSISAVMAGSFCRDLKRPYSNCVNRDIICIL